jgi:hypothetical protein
LLVSLHISADPPWTWDLFEEEISSPLRMGSLQGEAMKFIAALNALNQPWVAIIVIILGMAFDMSCKHYGVSNDAATGVIGAGIGLLTGQGLRTAAADHVTATITSGPESGKEPSHVSERQ